MNERLLANTILIIHFGWILFMLYGFALTVRALWRPVSWAFWDRWLFRSIHLGGILFVASLELLGKYCPLTIWEYGLRRGADPSAAAPDWFVIGWIERLIYPDVSPLVYLIPTYAIALFTLVMFVWKPPSKFRRRGSL
jgi:hypothetical protein